MMCVMKAKELIADNEFFESVKSTDKRIRFEVTAEVRNAYADSIREEVKEQVKQREKAEHAKMMASARNAQHAAAKELFISVEEIKRFIAEQEAKTCAV